MSELPKGWVQAKLSEVAHLVMGQSPPSNTYNASKHGLPFFQGKAEFGDLYPTVKKYCSCPVKVARAGDVLISVRAPVGPTNLCAEDSCIGRGLAAIRPLGGIPNYFLLYYLRSIEGSLAEQGTGSTFTAISKSDLEQIDVPLPPLNEQRRIVAKLERLLSRVDTAQARLAKIPRILKRFRQSVLAAACSGRLTADWRGNPKNEKSNSLPSTWKRRAVEEMLLPGGIFDGPFGSNLKTSDYTDSGVRVIRLENVGHLAFNAEKETYVSTSKYESLIRHTVNKRDIIFASFIADEIRACILPDLKTKAIAKADCFCLRPNEELVDRAYLNYQLVSNESYVSLINSVHGATRPRINTAQLRKLMVRICPLSEQQEIVRRVEALFKTADTLEARYLKAKEYVDKLTQSLLARAFRGELVRQDPNDEPASALLERIWLERIVESRKSRGHTDDRIQ